MGPPLAREIESFSTNQEPLELRERADRIRVEASEALAAKDNSFHERELIFDEAMRLKQKHDILLNEFNIAQQDVIHAGRLIHDEQSAVLLGRQLVTEEEADVQHLTNELSSMKSFLKIESMKSIRLCKRGWMKTE